jgi:hypothetical protein
MAMRPSLRQHHGSPYGEIGPPYSIIAYPVYNRTREDVIKNKLPSGGDEELGLPSKGFRWGYAPHPEFRGQRLLTYRGKPASNI